ncbi:MAG TPA: rhomboid family intramembrane serine protease [Crocinitomicaceae bacterium]|nr:rhomboid family intramembrane serine protease [Crocinitomicaceae bacterium]
MLRNLTPVVKNLILLNVVVYIVGLLFLSKGVDLTGFLGAHYITSPLFQPYQVVTHFFSHSLTSPFHIFMNMFVLAMFGPILERVWGSKRFFIAYIVSALGAYFIYSLAGSYDLYQLKQTIIAMGVDIHQINDVIVEQPNLIANVPEIREYMIGAKTPMVGASGAVFGIMAAFAYLFPNTEMYLMFIPIPIKAKFLIGGYFLVELYLSIQNMQGSYTSSVAHLAHVGGAIFGFILVYIWNKQNRNNFY